MNETLLPFPNRRQQVGGTGGNDQGFDARLRTVEGDLREIKTDMKHVATKKDISDLGSSIRIWILSGTVATLVIVIGWLVGWVIRLATGQPS